MLYRQERISSLREIRWLSRSCLTLPNFYVRMYGIMHIAVYPGSFDPFTLGHLDIVERVSVLFDKLIIGVGVNNDKTMLFSAEERVELIRRSTVHVPNLETVIYQGLTVKFVQETGARIMIRGVRPLTDIAAELTMMMANRRLAPNIETLFMVADGELAHVSSSLIKGISTVADEAAFANFLPGPIIQTVLARMTVE